MNKLIFSLLFLYSSYSEASLRSLISELLAENYDIKKAEVDNQISRNQSLDVLDTFRWGVDATYTSFTNELDTASNINNNGETQTNSLNLTRPFSWGGSLKFENTLEKSNSYFSVQAVKPVIWEFSQYLTYSQDIGKNFFGRNSRREINLATEASHIAELNNEKMINDRVSDFVRSYARAAFALSKVNFQKQAIERAKKRFDLISRRVRDGLSLKVDKLEAQNALMIQKENLSQIEVEFDSFKRDLSSLLHRRIRDNEIYEIEKVKLKEYDISKSIIADSIDLKILSKRYDVAKMNYEIAKNNFVPDVNFSFSYGANDFSSSSSESLSNGKISGENTFSTFVVSLSVPIDWSLEKRAKETEFIKFELAKYQNRSVKDNLSLAFNNLIFRRGQLKNLINSAKERINIARKTVGEYSNLYRRGKVRLDQVIRAEENYLQVQRNYAQLISSKLELEVSISQIFGKTKTFTKNNL